MRDFGCDTSDDVKQRWSPRTFSEEALPREEVLLPPDVQQREKPGLRVPLAEILFQGGFGSR